MYQCTSAFSLRIFSFIFSAVYVTPFSYSHINGRDFIYKLGMRHSDFALMTVFHDFSVQIVAHIGIFCKAPLLLCHT